MVNEDKNLGDAVVDRAQSFTRGPWTISTTITATGDWPCVRGALDEDGGWVVALIDQQCVSRSTLEPEANARLIAAAPALYEALRNIAERCGRRECERYSTGIGSCFTHGRTVNSQFAAEKCCAPCIANAALALVDKPSTESAKRPISDDQQHGQASKTKSS